MIPSFSLRRRAGSGSRPFSARERRRRFVIALLALSVGWKVVLLGLGGTLPRLLIKDGLADVSPEERPYGVEAMTTARALWSGPIERHSVRRVRLVSIERLVDRSAASCGGLTARVRAYTFFAIPYSEVRTVCDRGTVEYRVLPRRTRAH